MKVRVGVILLILCLWGGSLLYAMSNDIKIFVNNSEQSSKAVEIDGKVYVPLNQLSNEQQVMLKWDEEQNKLNIYKPNVHLTTLSTKGAFGDVPKGTHPISVLAQVDNLRTDIAELKITITSPQNKEKLIQSLDTRGSKDSSKENFWFLTDTTEYNFDKAGNYYVRLYMKPTFSKEWFLVSEKQIISK
ncbi:copper amine oxidase [Paenibacillus spongiae]|uniref:Copper amine oxidase n=1 Tax=Paenibacillus spongiae TaxID=2909671 RepID=A0ABY5S6R1_9BACL|nr:copper amine oxidase [Paenibacillus spongiae]UVI29596.1 copper amine oxidase [Paenibacillus spongiae]